MKMTKRKIFSIVMASIALFLFINTFIPHLKSYGSKVNLWDYKGIRVMMLISLLAIIAIYLLHLFMNLKHGIVRYANYATGYVTIFYLSMFFGNTDYLYVGIWLGLIASLGLAAISVLTTLTVQAIKKLLDERKMTYSSNALAAMVAICMSLICSLAYCLYNTIFVNVQVVISIITLMFLSFLGSTVGYDKVTQLIKQMGEM